MFQKKFMDKAITLAVENVKNETGGPFGAVIVKNNKIISTGTNTVTSANDPTAHAEINAIRNACVSLNNYQLDDCEIYSSCEPCPMCLGAIYWARPKALYFAATKKDAANAGFDDSSIYKELQLPVDKRSIKTMHFEHPEALKAFKTWNEKEIKLLY